MTKQMQERAAIMAKQQRTNAYGRPTHSSGNLCCNIWCVGTYGIWQIVLGIVPISRIRSRHIGGYPLENHPYGTDCASPHLPNTASPEGGVEQ